MSDTPHDYGGGFSPEDEQSSSPHSPAEGGIGKGRKRVGFYVSPPSEGAPSSEVAPAAELGHADVSRNASVTSVTTDIEPSKSPTPERMRFADFDNMQLERSLDRLKDDSTPTVLKSALRKDLSRANRPESLDLAGIEDLPAKLAAEDHARARASGLERDVASAPGSRSTSPRRSRSRPDSFYDASEQKSRSRPRNQDPLNHIWSTLFHRGGVNTGQNTPDAEELEEYFPEPPKYRAGGLSHHLLSQWWQNGGHSRTPSSAGGSVPPSPGTMSPPEYASPDRTPPKDEGHDTKYWPWSRSPRASQYGIGGLISASASSTALAGPNIAGELRKQAAKSLAPPRSPGFPGMADLPTHRTQPKRKKSNVVDITIKKHIQETKMRKRYLLKLCRALMEYGAPTHRLEAYMTMTSRVLEIEAQFLYFPGTMIITFDDSQTHTAEMKLVRVNQGVDLGKMKDTHNIYKDVSHDLIGVEEGIKRLDEVSEKGDRFPIWLRVLAFGFGSATVAPFAFEARPIDLPIAFGLGIILGVLQLLVAPKSDLYASVFEIAATIITSFLSRAFGSIRNGDLFCFSALAQSSIALILPGFTVLNAALELQSRSIVAGSVRIVYAIIYSLWIGYGLTIGTAIYGAIDKDAVSQSTCTNPLSTNQHKYIFLFMPVYTFCLGIINQAKFKQMPMMILISFAGYQVNYWASTQFEGNTQVASTLGAAAIGVLANGYSRMGLKIDAFTVACERWLNRNMRHRTLRKDVPHTATHAKSPASSRKSSVADSLLCLLPEPIRPRRLSEKDVESSGGSDNEDTQKVQGDGSGNPEGKNSADGGGEASGKDKIKDKKVNYVLAAAAMLPAIFVQVPSGVSVAGSLVQGIEAANLLTSNSNSTASGVVSASDVTDSNGNITANISFTVAASVVQVAIGITVGLFIGSILVYPTGKGGSIGQGKKSRSGLFAF